MEFNPQSYAPDGTAIFGNDAQLLVKFFVHPELSKFKSDKEEDAKWLCEVLNRAQLVAENLGF